MTEKNRKPLVLVVDDEPDWQSKIRRMLEEQMEAEVEVAGTIQEACQVALKHLPGSSTPLDLMTVDMRMPAVSSDTVPEETAGIEVLRTYRLIHCPMIVFTQWPSYENCIRAVQAGAAAYIPKIKEKRKQGDQGGFEELTNWCEKVLVRGAVPELPLPPDDQWLDRNCDWLATNCKGQWVALMDAGKVKRVPPGAQIRDGLLILSAGAYEELRKAIVESPEVLGQSPAIVFVPEESADSSAH
jgi:CheY-like chemotaxis protein